MDKLNDAYHDVDAMLKEIMHLIKVKYFYDWNFDHLGFKVC
jgi:hypothetical protein